MHTRDHTSKSDIALAGPSCLLPRMESRFFFPCMLQGPRQQGTQKHVGLACLRCPHMLAKNSPSACHACWLGLSSGHPNADGRRRSMLNSTLHRIISAPVMGISMHPIGLSPQAAAAIASSGQRKPAQPSPRLCVKGPSPVLRPMPGLMYRSSFWSVSMFIILKFSISSDMSFSEKLSARTFENASVVLLTGEAGDAARLSTTSPCSCLNFSVC